MRDLGHLPIKRMLAAGAATSTFPRWSGGNQPNDQVNMPFSL